MHIRLVMRHACYQNYGHVNMLTTHHLRVAAPDLQSCIASAVNSQLDVELLHALRNLKFSGTKMANLLEILLTSPSPGSE